MDQALLVSASIHFPRRSQIEGAKCPTVLSWFLVEFSIALEIGGSAQLVQIAKIHQK